MSIEKKAQERRWLDQAIADLGWQARVVAENEGPPSEPPDFDVQRDGLLIGLEVRRVFQREGDRGGSVERERESIWGRFQRDLADRYYANPRARPIRLSACLPGVVDSPAVRPTTIPELNAQMKAIADQALGILEGLHLAPWENHKFEVCAERCSPPAIFWVRGLPDEAEFHGYRRWCVYNQTTGWVRSFAGPDLEAAVADKAVGRRNYASRYSKTALLLVADGARASGYSELGRGPVASHGFDEIYFCPIFRGRTVRVPRREDPVEQKEAREIMDVAARGEGHLAWCASRNLVDGQCDCEVKQAAEVRDAVSDLLGVVWDVTVVEGEPDGPPGTFLSREDAGRLREVAKKAKDTIADVIRLASEIAHGATSVEGQNLHGAVERVREVSTPRRPGQPAAPSTPPK